MTSKKKAAVVDPLFAALGPLATFSAKVRIAFSFGLISEWIYHDLEVLRKLRNQFAHTLESLKFNSPNVVKLTQRLLAPDICVEYMAKHPEEYGTATQKTPPLGTNRDPEKTENVRQRVMTAVSFIGGDLSSRTCTLESDLPLSAKYKIIEGYEKQLGEPRPGAGGAGIAR